MVGRETQPFAIGMNGPEPSRGLDEFGPNPALRQAFMRVLAAGQGKILDNGEVRPMDVKVGDKVLFGQYGGTVVKVNGEELMMMREEDIMGVIEA